MQQEALELPGINSIKSAMLREKVASLEKEANPGLLRQGLGAIGTFFRQRPVAATLTTGLGAYGTALGGTHAYNAMRGTPDPTKDMSWAQAFQHHNNNFETMASPIRSELNAAIQAGDWAKATELQSKLSTGNFGGGGGSSLMRRIFVPWGAQAAAPNAAHHRQQAMRAQSTLQRQYDDAMRGHLGTPAQMQQQMSLLQQQMQNPNMMPMERQMLEMQMNQMRQRLRQGLPAESEQAAAIATRMRNAGMHWRPYSPNGGQQPGMPGAGHPGVYQGSSPWGHTPAGPTTVPNPATMGMNAGISPTMMNTNPWALNNAVMRHALNGNDFRVSPRV